MELITPCVEGARFVGTRKIYTRRRLYATVKVEKGDTITSIIKQVSRARNANDENKAVAEIAEFNCIVNPNIIYPGQIIKIPCATFNGPLPEKECAPFDKSQDKLLDSPHSVRDKRTRPLARAERSEVPVK